MEFTGPQQRWQIWLDIETLEPKDREAGVIHKDFNLDDLTRAARGAIRAVQDDMRVTVTRLTLHRDEDER